MNAFMQIFKDNNDYNEKNIIGFLSFAIMVIYSLVDLVTGIWGINLAIHQYVYESFIVVTLGSFGIAGLEKFSPTARVKAENEGTTDE